MKYVISLVVLTALSLSGSAQDSNRVNTFTLAEAQKYALSNNAYSKNATLDVEYAKKQVLETAAIGFPQVNSFLTYQNFIDIPTQVIPANTFDPNAPADLLIPVQFGIDQNMSLGLNAKQLLFDGSYIVGLQAARTFVDLSRRNEQAAQIDVKHNVAKAYYAVLVTQESREVLGHNIKTLEKVFFETSQMYENGFVEKLDVDRLDLSLSNLRTGYNNMVRQEKLAKFLLKYQIGLPLTDSLHLSDSLSVLTSFLNQAVSTDANVEGRVEWQQLMIQSRLAKLNLRRYRSHRLPSLGASLSYSTNAFRNEFSFTEQGGQWWPTTVYGFQINLPLIGFKNRALIQQAKIDMQKLENGKRDLQAALDLQIRQARSGYLNAYDDYLTQQKNLGIAREIHRVASVKYNEGIGSSLEVANAQTELNTTQTNYSNALFNLLNAKADLDKAMGTN